MRKKDFRVWRGASLAGILFGLSLSSIQAQAPASVAVSGQVSSNEEGPLEGVWVSAKKDGSSITVTVVSDPQGRYRFPASKLGPGKYSLRAAATGYVLEGPASVEITPPKAATADLQLRKASVDQVASQLSNSEWLMSIPGTGEQKAAIRGCTHCHTLERIMRSRHDAAEFEQVLARMGNYTPESFPLMIQPPNRGGGRVGGGELAPEERARQQENRRRMAEYLSSLNLSKVSQWEYSFKTLPRPSGKAARVLITEYDLPKPTHQPHDVVVDKEGWVWYASFGEPILGKLDPKTGQVTQYDVPVPKPGHIIGTLDLEFDKEQNLWLAQTFQAAIHKFDRKTGKFQTFRLPPELDSDYREFTFVAPQNSHVDGKVWINDSGTWTQLRLDTATGKFEVFEVFPVPRPNTYQILSDSQNNAFINVFGRENIGRIDAKTGKVTVYNVPTPRSNPRRGKMDPQDRLWFAENRASKIGMFDTRSEKFQEWAVPTPEYYPYDVVPDKNGEAWAVTEFANRVLRLDSKTGQFTAYALPQETNMRRAFVDDSKTPVTFWVGGTHTASIVKLEPLE